MNIKAVLFDVGNTLVDSHHGETLREILAAHGIFESIDRVRQAMARGNKEFDIEKHTHLSAHEFYTEWNLVVLKHLGIDTSTLRAKKLAEEIDFEWFQFAKFQVYPEVKETLQGLRKLGLKLGVITQGYEEDLEKVLPKAGLEGFFEVCVGINTTGKRKPHKEVFEHAVRRLGVKLGEAIFVGDDLEADYCGAERAGMTPVLIRREGSPVLGVRSIQSLDGIFKVLEELNP